MENFKRMNANSKIITGPIGLIIAKENDKTMILQIVPLNYKEVNEKDGVIDVFLCEYISRLECDNVPANTPTNTMPRGDIEFENDLDTTINKDPFGGKWTGKTIRAVFDAGDVAWVERALKEMKNTFIRDRLDYIMSRGGYGKIRN